MRVGPHTTQVLNSGASPCEIPCGLQVSVNWQSDGLTTDWTVTVLGRVGLVQLFWKVGTKAAIPLTLDGHWISSLDRYRN